MLSSHLGVPHISTGEMLRALDSDTGEAIHERIQRGHFAPDEYILKMVEDRLAQPDCEPGYLLDGFPRTLVQASAFEEAMPLYSQRLDHVIHMVVSAEELIRRLSERARSGERVDDSVEFIQDRFRIYEQRTAPVLKYYEERGLVREVDGMSAQQTVLERICRAIE